MAMDDPHNFNHASHSFLTKGSKVEVSSDENGSDGAWFVATVIHPPPSISDQNHLTRNNLVYVEYQNLLTEDGASRLREYANVACVRPSPDPDTNSPDFQLNDDVDAFYRDGWWTGVITIVVDTSNFIVTFRNPPDQIQFHISDLRVHRKWVDGIWIEPQHQRTAGLMFTVGKKVEVSFERENLRDVWFPATVLKNSGNDTFLVEYQQPGNGDEPILHKVTVDYLHIRPSPPHLRDTNFVLLEKVDAFYDYGWWSGVITKELPDNRYNVFFKHTKNEKEFVCSHVRPHIEWKGGKWFNTPQGGTDKRTPRKRSTVVTPIMKNTNSKKLKDDNEIMFDDSSEKTNGQTGGQSEGLDDSIDGVNDQAFGRTENLSHGKKVRSKRGKGIEQKTPTIGSSKKKGRLANELKSLQASGAIVDPVKRRVQEIVEKDFVLPIVVGLQCNKMTVSRGKIVEKLETKEPDVLLESLAVVDTVEKEATVSQKRKRGRPPKLQATSPTINHENAGVVVEGGQSQTKEVGLAASTETKSLEENQKAVKEQAEIVGKKHGKRKKGSWSKVKRGKRRTISINTDSLAQDASKEKADGSLEKDSTTINPEASVGKSLSEDQPLSTWFEGNKEQSLKATESRLQIVTCDTDTEDISFIRTTPLWQTIESMEAFRKLPQKPHFRPLLQGVKASAREGLAIGTMVTFSTVVDKTRGLRFDDPRNAIEDCLEALVELESNGFDVGVIRDRLTGLLLIKDKQEELEDRSKGVEVKIEEHRVQGNRVDEKIEEIDRQIRVLEENRSRLLTKKEKKESEINVMKGECEMIEKEIEKVVAEFEELAAASF